MSHQTLYNLANYLGALAMVTVVAYHFVAVNARHLAGNGSAQQWDGCKSTVGNWLVFSSGKSACNFATTNHSTLPYSRSFATVVLPQYLPLSKCSMHCSHFQKSSYIYSTL
ncbi:hypothetical protein SERLA73DRAFT_179074 [Serpula lacrymans var. lacrymans S7.3]|uniref:Uncharacterized protein n=2 Tax=Serpula lacrymans var. lacrymans TaxID=341189 RepID=F8PTP0_SERL3|nr:uncharacterized protein SERLADRAFT_464026 [Serpula lacrymans var. lacrymans S7.9]EGO01035.1 hypothetical protein SERLA73DRAFT_179074 [Serpula lacrymans var. lacrymans S7.3]EGO26701.1 hypothetical protein SERLADRAFT_464026 [Serpula lacrymans var. lacrymans S7.9]